ncbi:MAG: YtxH domain-containing protein [Actinomycetota bacterium]|nr:YtxH domain-containing protein [Actinomycetota bacterium]
MLDKQRLRTFLLGGAAGILAGILLAPRSGRELRGSIADRAGEARERSRETYFEAQERMRERLAEAREGSRRRPEDTDLTTAGAAGPSPEEETPASQRRPQLRDVSRDVAGEDPGGGHEEGTTAERSEELRKKVRETRARLTERLDGSRGEQEDRDLGPEL